MPRTHGKIKIEVWESGSEFRQLPVDAQWAYEMLVSQPGVTMCGVVPYTPKRWARLARDLTIERVEHAIAVLEQDWYVVVDREHDELLIRTFIHHDEPWKLPNLVKAARRQFREIDSQVIRDYLAERHEWLVEGLENVDAKAIESYEKRRAAERTSERTSRLPFERASERASLREEDPARTRTPTATATTTAPTTAPAERALLEAERSETTRASDLPFEKERLMIRLLSEIGGDADEGTRVVVRSYADRLPEGALVRVLESLGSVGARNRAAYAVGALKSELNGEPDEPEPELPEPGEKHAEQEA